MKAAELRAKSETELKDELSRFYEINSHLYLNL